MERVWSCKLGKLGKLGKRGKRGKLGTLGKLGNAPQGELSHVTVPPVPRQRMNCRCTDGNVEAQIAIVRSTDPST